MSEKKLIEKLKEYHFQFKHLTVIFVVLFTFQLIVSFINKSSIRSFFDSTQSWYQKDSAERLANLSTTTFELLLETINRKKDIDDETASRITKAFDIIFSQEVLQHNIEELCILIKKDDNIYAIDDGKTLFRVLYLDSTANININKLHPQAVSLYKSIHAALVSTEQIKSIITNKNTFNTFVPLVLRGEYIGAVYMKNTPDFSFISSKIISNYDETSILYLSLISLGLLSMYFVSSYTVKERDETQKLFLIEHEDNLKKQINYQKEMSFTKRIYHTHHKAEKIMGFIKGDLSMLSPVNINEIKYRVSKYANFISRIIYDMKWYEPPVQTIRNPIFKTDLNEVIHFIVNHIFLRSSKKSGTFSIAFEEGKNLPVLNINEFVIWEIIEPLVQNSIDHAGVNDLIIKIKTHYSFEEKLIKIILNDNGNGIAPKLLLNDEHGVRFIFRENVSTKDSAIQNVGYGCYIAYEMSKKCGWDIDAQNLSGGGSEFVISIKA
ncbi:MAG: ATP-binding protein [Bacteroidetes bacterium]|nr:ATP-binding protein [Bacteroidota bacterium]